MTTDDKRRGDLINRAQSLGMNDAEIQELLELTRADERRACAAIAENFDVSGSWTPVTIKRAIAKAIESRTDAD